MYVTCLVFNTAIDTKTITFKFTLATSHTAQVAVAGIKEFSCYSAKPFSHCTIFVLICFQQKVVVRNHKAVKYIVWFCFNICLVCSNKHFIVIQKYNKINGWAKKSYTRNHEVLMLNMSPHISERVNVHLNLSTASSALLYD